MASAATSLPVVSEKGESQASLHDTASHQTEDAPITPSLGESLFACWLIIRVIYPFQLAVFIPPLITAAIQPVIFNPEFSKIPPLGTWYTQVAVVAYQLGGLIGSALIPIYIPEHPKTTMLTAALTMSVFVGAFVITFKLAGGPIPIIVLAFVMYMCSGYLTSSVFCLAPSCMLADDAQMIQMMLVLTTATSLVLGGFISWAWLGIKI